MTTRIGVIGTGMIARRAHLPAYQEAGATIAAVADVVAGRAERAAKDFGARQWYTDYRELLADPEIDAISVCTPNHLHKQVTVDALRAGKHVLCEKPMAMDVDEAKEMRRVAEETGRLLMVGFQNRFRSDVQRLKEFVDAGELGRIYYARTGFVRRRGTPFGWFTVKEESGGGPMIDLGVHVMDFTRYLMGNPRAVSVTAATYQTFGHYQIKDSQAWCSSDVTDGLRSGEAFDVEDLAAAFIRFADGSVIVVEVSWAANTKQQGIYSYLYGEKAGACLSPLELYGVKHGGLVDAQIPVRDKKPHVELIRHFLDCVETGAPPVTTAQQGVEIQQIIDAVYESARTGSSVELEPLVV